MSVDNRQLLLSDAPALTLSAEPADVKTGLAIINAEFLEDPMLEWQAIDENPAMTPLPAFTNDWLPSFLGDVNEQVSRSVQVSPEVTALSLLIAVGAAAGRDHICKVKSGLSTRANLYGLFFLSPAERKTSTCVECFKPFYSRINDNMPSYYDALEKRNIKWHELESVIAKLSRADGKDKTADIKRHQAIRAELNDMDACLRDPSFISDDCTEEGLFSLYGRGQGQAALFSDDARKLLKITLGLYSGGVSREDPFLRGYDGSPIAKTRANKPTSLIKEPYLSMIAMSQPDFLCKLGESEDISQSGMLSRFILCVPDSNVGTRKYSDDTIDPLCASGYDSFIRSLLDENYGRKPGQPKIEYELQPQAKQLWVEYYNKIETALGKDGELQHMAAIAVRYPEFCRKFALISAICERPGRVSTTVTQEDMSRAIALTEYFAKHAERAFSVMKDISLPTEAQRVLRAITRNQLREFSLRDIERTTGMTAAEAESGIDLLASRNYVRKKKDQAAHEGAGRKASATYETNPETF